MSDSPKERLCQRDFRPQWQPQRPQNFDAVLGNQNIASPGSVILGGIEAVKTRLNSDSIQVKILALKDAMNYGDAGLQLVIEYLEAEESQIVDAAYSLLESRSEPFVRDRIERYLDDRELDLQDLKYSLLESSAEGSIRQKSKQRKASQNTENPQSRSHSTNEVKKNRWNNAS
jgi:hypothetical protein